MRMSLNCNPARRPLTLARAGILTAFALAAATARVSAQEAPESTSPSEGRIQDNSFLVEEAYNQEAGVVQHISQFTRSSGGGWVSSFTQEWPVNGVRHQLSATVQFARLADSGARGLGDYALNYRYQLVGDGQAKVAVAPRLSLLFPTGKWERGLGTGATGWQVNVPVSMVLSRPWTVHANLGATWTPSARSVSGDRADTRAWNTGGSVIFGGSRIADAMLEAVYSRSEEVAGRGRTATKSSAFVSPGVRWAWNVRGGLQIVPGVACPLGLGPSRGERQILVYLSFEHPFAPAAGR